MRIIEKIEIRNFRSIKKLDLDFNSSVSIFSGVNSCGKTNILRALNLFFNNEVGFEKKLSISDFFTEKGQPTSNISIKVYFNSYASELVKKQKKVPEKFSIKRTFIFRSGFFNHDQKIEGASSNQMRHCENFLKKWVKFHYIPTDRKVFFKKIYSELSEFLGSPFGFKQLKSQFDTMKINFSTIENSLNNRDFVQLNLSETLKKRLSISSVGYALPEIRNLLKALDFSIKRNSGEKSFVSTEGDGIKFINLLQILDIFDSRYSQESRSRPYVSIWAIDEPENSLEQKNIELFKQEIWDRYSKDKQIFLTSHSPEFLLEPDKIGRNKFYGFENVGGETKEIGDKSPIVRLPFTEFERELLIEKMGIGMTREEKMELKKQVDEYAKEQKKLELMVQQSRKPIIFVEGGYDIRYIKTASKLLGKNKLLNSVKLFDGGGFGSLDKIWKHYDSKLSEVVHQKVLLLFDCDTNKQDAVKGEVFKRITPSIQGNLIKKGIENLFPENTIEKARKSKEAFFDYTPAITRKVRGRDHVELEKYEVNKDEKNNLCTWICENGIKDDFDNFSKIIEIIENILISQTDEN